MSQWWRRHRQDFQKFDEYSKKRVEDLTGRIPLLLVPFFGHAGKTLQSLEPDIWEDPVLDNVVNNVRDFASKKRSEK